MELEIYLKLMTMQSLYMGFTCILCNSKDWLGTIYASFGVLGTECVCICILQNSNNQEFWMN
jgi:hypothetical protein